MKIIIGIDGSRQALVGVRWVANLPLSSDDDVLLASVVHAPVMVGAWGYTDTEVNRRAIERARNAAVQEAQRITARTLEELRGLACGVHSVALEGHPIEALELAVREYGADLLVVGPHGRGRLETILLGSVSQSLLHAMPTSILVAREPVGTPRRVLLATDGSRSGLAAARFVAVFPLASDAAIDIVMALGDWSSRYPSDGAADDADDLRAVEQRQVAGAMEEVTGVLDAAGRVGAPLLREGDAKRAILAVARERESDLIVMGTRGVGGFRRLVLGSVSSAVSKTAPCSTLVVASHHA